MDIKTPPRNYKSFLQDDELIAEIKLIIDARPSYLDFTTGEKITCLIGKPHSRFNANKQDLLAYDVISDSSLLPLVNQRVRDLLNLICPQDVQYIDCVLECNDGLLEGYQVINVVHTEDVLDLEKTIFEVLPGQSCAIGFHNLHFTSNGLVGHGIARVSDYRQLVVVSDEVRSAFVKHAIKGVCFLTAEAYSHKPSAHALQLEEESHQYNLIMAIQMNALLEFGRYNHWGQADYNVALKALLSSERQHFRATRTATFE